ncbi:MAG: SHOCT domain-containing protein [Streptosporangiales bacterium]|nr:SHOCT domain-containing protein [Streptosporangiales bacterium]
MWSMMGGMGLWMLVWVLLLLALLTAAVVGVIALARRGTNALRADQREERAVESPEDILKRRYAAGEIDEDEYHRRLSDLS